MLRILSTLSWLFRTIPHIVLPTAFMADTAFLP
jgi:uncharacterized protein YceK